jgi:hypothetical protein
MRECGVLKVWPFTSVAVPMQVMRPSNTRGRSCGRHHHASTCAHRTLLGPSISSAGLDLGSWSDPLFILVMRWRGRISLAQTAHAHVAGSDRLRARIRVIPHCRLLFARASWPPRHGGLIFTPKSWPQRVRQRGRRKYSRRETCLPARHSRARHPRRSPPPRLLRTVPLPAAHRRR